MRTYSEFTRVPLNMTYVNSLHTFLTELDRYNIKIEDIWFYQNGFQITFEGLPGDAILHDGSYGNAIGMWETMGFPWDYDDVSIHTTHELAELLKNFIEGRAV